ncbi:hypothetical protein HFO24_06740 [Rhizobium laguerreae]|uniref:hypothetical protein n=1 Tax=Rhizobium laguerreae TaxID=1076926 RepID=UPI001C911569|nr:hypothetical protein [Rhizobium laguerreae]MBY3181367.1 hypothetical protein [Rhizobium laguerreae]
MMATRITLADLSPCDDGTVLIARDAVNGSRRHISEVANGLRCGCVCFGCGRDLIARNGGDISLRRHSFAHRPDELSPNCATAGETALHILGKEIIARHGRVTMPETWMTDMDGKRRLVTPLQSIVLTDVRLESAEGDLIPDIVAISPDGRRLFIEIKNTHGCPPEKLEKLRSMDVDVLEIDVSGYRAHALDDLDEVILDLAPRMVIQSAALRAMAIRIADERAAREETRQTDAGHRIAIYRDRQMQHSPRAAELADEMIALGFAGQMDLDDTKPSAFRVQRRQWQAAILYRLGVTAYPDKVGAVAMLERLRERKWPKPELDFMSSEDTNWIAKHIAPDFKSAYEEVASYLKRLQKAGLVHEDMRSRYYMSEVRRDTISRAARERSRPTVRRQELDDALEEIRDLVASADEEWVHVDAWLEERAGELGTSVGDLLQQDDGRFDHLMGTLKTIRTSILRMQRFEQDEPPEDLAGLPLAGLFLRLGMTRLEAQEREELERAERIRHKAEARISDAVQAAIGVFGDPASWLDKPLLDSDGKTPRELAAENPSGLGEVLDAIAAVRARRMVEQRAENLKATALEKLRAEVARVIPRQDLVELWMRQSWSQLGGARPQEFCVDECTLFRCLEVLTETQGAQKRRP